MQYVFLMAVTSHILVQFQNVCFKCLCQSLRLAGWGCGLVVIVKFPTVCPNELINILAPCLSLTSAPQLLVAFCTAMLCFVAWFLFSGPG